MENRIVAEMLNTIGFKVMASQAAREQSKEILRGYVVLVKLEAIRRKDWTLLHIAECVLRKKS